MNKKNLWTLSPIFQLSWSWWNLKINCWSTVQPLSIFYWFNNKQTNKTKTVMHEKWVKDVSLYPKPISVKGLAFATWIRLLPSLRLQQKPEKWMGYSKTLLTCNLKGVLNKWRWSCLVKVAHRKGLFQQAALGRGLVRNNRHFSVGLPSVKKNLSMAQRTTIKSD